MESICELSFWLHLILYFQSQTHTTMNHIVRSENERQAAIESARMNRDEFWGDFASKEFIWHKPWNRVSNCDLHQANIKWFEGASLNITENCLDRHTQNTPDKVALIFEPNDVNEAVQKITYSELLKQVNKTANMLKELGAKKGDRICLYMPMIPELAYAVLACARIGAIHSVVFAGFSAKSLSDRINDASCKYVLTADGGNRGAKVTPLKSIVDEALLSCECVEKVVVVNRCGLDVSMKTDRDIWWKDLFAKASEECDATYVDAEDPLFILYTSGSTGKPKGMVHSSAGYMVYTNYTFRNVFQYKEGEIYWCTADIGWITGHSYILYGPLSAGATSVMFEGVPSFPDMGRFWQIVDKHKVNVFYTAPTAIRALAKCDIDFVKRHDLSSLRVLGTVGEPINQEAWDWYHEEIGGGKCPIVDTWWQTETGGILISSLAGVTPSVPTMATLPLPGIEACLKDGEGNEIKDIEAEGALCIKAPWPSMARTIWGDHQRFIDTYYAAFPGTYFTGDGAKRNSKGQYRITGRMDDVVIVSGHNLGTAEIENSINQHEDVAESAVVGFPHEVKGQAICAFVTLKHSSEKDLTNELNQLVRTQIGPIATPEQIILCEALPKTRSGKIMRRILRKLAEGERQEFGDISTLLNPECVEGLIQKMS